MALLFDSRYMAVPEFAQLPEWHILIVEGDEEPAKVVVIYVPVFHLLKVEGGTIVLELIETPAIEVVGLPGHGYGMDTYDFG